MLKVGMDMIYLAACALHSETPDIDRVRDMDIAAVYKMAKLHSMSSIIYISLTPFIEGGVCEVIDQGAAALMRRDFGISLRKLFALESERAALTKFFEENNIWYLTLKGILLQDLYPKMGMRQMTDNDILINPRCAKRVKKYFVNRGYEVYSYGKGCHDIYIKDSVTFEIHRSLAADTKKNEKASAFCDSAVERSLLTANSPALRLSEEDFYVYYIFHTYKHFSGSGCGIRSLMDIFVYTESKRNTLDREHVSETLGLIDLFAFERSARSLSEKLFAGGISCRIEDFNEEERELLLYFISSGTFGTRERLMRNTLDDISENKEIGARVKLKYILGRVFPRFEYYRLSYPRLYKFIVTIPFLWLIRLFRGLKRSRDVKDEMRELKNLK